jgi:hypothetical protein
MTAEQTLKVLKQKLDILRMQGLKAARARNAKESSRLTVQVRALNIEIAELVHLIETKKAFRKPMHE